MRKPIIPLLALLLCICLVQSAFALTGFQFADSDPTPTVEPAGFDISLSTRTLYPDTDKVTVTLTGPAGDYTLAVILGEDITTGEVIHSTTIEPDEPLDLVGFTSLELQSGDIVTVLVLSEEEGVGLTLTYVDDAAATAEPAYDSAAQAFTSSNKPYVDVLNSYAIGFDGSGGTFSGGRLQLTGWICHQPGTVAYFDSYDLLDASGTAVVTGYFEDGEISLCDREDTDAMTGGKISGSTASDAGFTFTASFGSLTDGDYTLQFYTSDTYGKAMQTASIVITVGSGGSGGSAGADGDTSQTLSVGSCVKFGSYPQTAGGNDSTPIEWLVLDTDGERALLLSSCGLNVRAYDSEDADVTWEDCSLRTWLNGTFFSRAFDSNEQQAILMTDVDSGASQCYSAWDTDGGNDTQDKVFLLSYAEAYKYFSVTEEDGDNAAARVAPTEFAKANDAYTNLNYTTEDGETAGYWWLRSPGSQQNYAALVDPSGALFTSHVDELNSCIRPAIWVDMSLL